MPQIVVAPLRTNDVATVYPLVREVVRGLDLPEWLRFARRVSAPGKGWRSGIMVARWAGQSFPCGLFCYRRTRDLQYGPVLIAEHIVALDILDPKPILAALMAELDALANRIGCPTVQSVVRNSSDDVTMGLLQAGHQPESATLAKRITANRSERARL